MFTEFSSTSAHSLYPGFDLQALSLSAPIRPTKTLLAGPDQNKERKHQIKCGVNCVAQLYVYSCILNAYSYGDSSYVRTVKCVAIGVHYKLIELWLTLFKTSLV